MAKLNVVIPSVDVAVNGVKYRKVERSAVAGDIVKALTSTVDIGDGSFYEVFGKGGESVYLIDDEGDCREQQLRKYPSNYEVYEKVTEPSTKPSAPVKYREVKRKANVGERIKALEGQYGYTVGDELVVTNADRWGDGTGVSADPNDAALYHSEYVVLEQITEPIAPTKPERLKVGEYAKVIGGDNYYTSVGDIVKLVGNELRGFKVADIGGTELAGVKFFKSLVRATNAEVASVKQALERTKAIGEFAEGGHAVMVNATLGNTLGFERGDYVIVRIKPDYGPSALIVETKRGNVGYCNADALRKITKEEYEAATKPALIPVGQYGKITHAMFPKNSAYIGSIVEIIGHDGPSIAPYSVRTIVGGVEKFALADGVVPVTSVEVEAVRKETQEIAQWNAIGRKVGEYKAGDVVRVIKSCWIADTKEGDITSIAELRRGGVALTQLNSSGVNAWVIAEEIELLAPVESLFNTTTAGGEHK